jgi:hypothetical protein
MKSDNPHQVQSENLDLVQESKENHVRFEGQDPDRDHNHNHKHDHSHNHHIKNQDHK